VEINDLVVESLISQAVYYVFPELVHASYSDNINASELNDNVRVKKIVNGFILRKKALEVSNTNFGDPAPRKTKFLVLHFDFNGEIRRFRWQEGEKVDFTADLEALKRSITISDQAYLTILGSIKAAFFRLLNYTELQNLWSNKEVWLKVASILILAFVTLFFYLQMSQTTHSL